MERNLHATQPDPRFWNIAVRRERITITSGPLHTPGTSRHIDCKSGEVALKTAQALVDQRLKDGFRDAAVSAPAATMDLEAERALLTDAPEGWLVFADELLEGADRLRGELISLQVRAAKRVRGSITQTKNFIKEHFDALVGPDLGAVHKQVTLDWRFGYVRSARIWSGPHSPPIADAIAAVLHSPASRFLQRLEFGSPGGEGRYDTALRVLAKQRWPAHLDSLVLGNFDVDAAQLLESAWPRLESLAALGPVASRLRSLDVRAVMNTLGRGLSFPKLEHLMLRPSVLDARLVGDLQSLEAPQLITFGLGSDAVPKGGWAQLAAQVRQWLVWTRLRALDLSSQRDGLGLLEALGLEALGKLERLVFLEGVAQQRLNALANSLSKATLVLGDEALAKRLSPRFPRIEVIANAPKKPVALPRRRKRTEDE